MNQVKMVLIFAILLFLSCVNVSAQVIKGRVTDSTTNEALSYAAPWKYVLSRMMFI